MSVVSVIAVPHAAVIDRRPMRHVVKSWPEFFQAILDGRKRHELRRASERDYRVGDTLHLREYEPQDARYTGREQRVLITYITSSDYPCALSEGALADGYCVLSIYPLKEESLN